VFVGPDDVTGFALPAAALGLRLTGAVPFGELVAVRIVEPTGEIPAIVVGMNLLQAEAFLDDHINLEKMLAGERATAPTLERIRELLGVLGDPERQYPIVHVTGTNGKTSTARAISSLLAAHDLSVGTYTSPHLRSVTERLLWNGEPIGAGDFATLIEQFARLERS